jgi:TetR/AcrR family transcriptional repressor of nem operon
MTTFLNDDRHRDAMTMMSVIVKSKGRGRKVMGVPKEQASRNRQAIIDAASRAFRERGVDGVGVADLMKDAGFTHGGFYNHFVSKDALAAECCASVFAQAAAQLRSVLESGGKQPFREVLEAYLSCEHRDAPGEACPSATLAVDAARHGHLMQAAYADGIAGFLEVIESYLASRPGQCGTAADIREDAIGLLVNLVGSIVVARGVGLADIGLSEEILAVGRKRLPA